MQFAAAQANGGDEGGWEIASSGFSDLEDEEGHGAPNFMFRSNGGPQLHDDPGQPVMINGRAYLVGGPAELEARAQFLAYAWEVACRR